MKTVLNMFVLALALVALLAGTQATALLEPLQPAARVVSSVSPIPTDAFGGPTAEMTACLEKTECHSAAAVYNYCVECLPNAHYNNEMLNLHKNNTATFECLCDTYHDIWLTSLRSCIPCLATALANRNADVPSTAVNPAILLGEVVRGANSFCMVTGDSRVHSLMGLVNAGTGITSRFHSPVLIFNVTVARGPVPDFGF